MDIRVRRACASALLCALTLRFTDELPLNSRKLAQALLFLETGQVFRAAETSETTAETAAATTEPAAAPTTVPTEAATEAAAPTETAASITAADIPITYSCSLRPDIEALYEQELTFTLDGDEPTVLIVHTHTTECYADECDTLSDYRTLDESCNMLSIGDEVARRLEAGGVSVLHDRTLHDYPSYNNAYIDAREAIQAALAENPSIVLVLDLHRDAADTSTGQLRTLANVDGQSSAQLMLVVGTNATRTHDSWQDNLSLALKLHAALESIAPGIMRPLNLRAQRFNQDLSAGALLVEVGAAGNSHDEALRAAAILAEGILALFHTDSQ